jgi:hypothetical protein
MHGGGWIASRRPAEAAQAPLFVISSPCTPKVQYRPTWTASTVSGMDTQAFRVLIRQKMAAGRLPHDPGARVWQTAPDRDLNGSAVRSMSRSAGVHLVDDASLRENARENLIRVCKETIERAKELVKAAEAAICASQMLAIQASQIYAEIARRHGPKLAVT